jgi:hypothetical protein
MTETTGRVSYEVADDNKFSGKTRINTGSLSAMASKLN